MLSMPKVVFRVHCSFSFLPSFSPACYRKHFVRPRMYQHRRRWLAFCSRPRCRSLERSPDSLAWLTIKAPGWRKVRIKRGKWRRARKDGEREARGNLFQRLKGDRRPCTHSGDTQANWQNVCGFPSCSLSPRMLKTFLLVSWDGGGRIVPNCYIKFPSSAA